MQNRIADQGRAFLGVIKVWYLIWFQCTVHIKVSWVCWQGQKVEAREPEVMSSVMKGLARHYIG
jgi:hypothetical protein